MAKELQIPPPATLDPNGVEMARLWIADRGFHCTLNIGMYENVPGLNETNAWAVIIGDLTQHVANGLSQHYGRSREEVREELSALLAEQLAKAAPPSRGGMVE